MIRTIPLALIGIFFAGIASATTVPVVSCRLVNRKTSESW